jgi:hypothetical protein
MISGTTLIASGGAGGAGTELTLRIPNETVPAGSLVQMKVDTTEVSPISGGRPKLLLSSAFSGVAGFGMFAPSGEIAGVAVVNANDVRIFYNGTSTLTANYPILTVVVGLQPDLPVGTKATFTLDPLSLFNFGSGLTFARINPGTVTVDGNIAITDVIPGEGVWPAGTVISVRGVGFSSKTSFRVNDAGVRGFTVVSPNELQFTLTQATNMRGLKLTASDRNSVDYYAYMRGITDTVSARTLLASTEPIFSVDPRSVATFGPVPALAGSVYYGLALQNPTAADAVLQITLLNPDGSVNYQASRILPTRHRLVLEASELLDGVAPPTGSSIVVSASAPIDAFAVLVNEGTGDVAPLLPIESRP